MVKPLTISTTFKNDNQIFTCYSIEFVNKVAERYGIDMENYEMFVNRRGGLQKVKPQNLTDHMKIEIVPKSALQNGQKSLGSYFNANKEVKKNNEIQTIIMKLTKNCALTGLERKDLVQLLTDKEELSSSVKRKISDVNSNSEKTFANKKTQVNMSQSKDSFTQTDNLLKRSSAQDADEEPIAEKIRKIASMNSAPKSEIKKLMHESFEERRNFILLKRPMIQLVKDKYPLLFSFEELKSELDRLFFVGKYASFIENMKKYSKPIIDSCTPTDDLYKDTQDVMQCAETDIDKTYARIVGSVYLLTKNLLKENIRFIQLTDSASGSSDIYPHIVARCSLKETLVKGLGYSVIVENQKVCEAPTFQDAICCLMTSFFIFNIDYPTNNRRTLIAFEKLFLDANDTMEIDDLTSQLIRYLQLKASNQNPKGDVVETGK